MKKQTPIASHLYPRLEGSIALLLCIALASLSFGEETGAKAPGEPPRQLGPHGNAHSIRILGADSIDEQELRAALLRSPVFVLSSHPRAELAPFINTVERLIRTGLQRSGFPDARVHGAWDPGHDGIVIRILNEGIRYRYGDIHCSGMNIIGENELRDILITSPPQDMAPNGAEKAFRGAEQAKRIPSPIVKEAAVNLFPQLAEEARTLDWSANIMSDTRDQEDFDNLWAPGKWADYRLSTLQRIRNALRITYAAEGKLFAKFDVNWIPRPREGVVDLEIKVLDEGPDTTLRNIHFRGNTVNSRDDLLTFLSPVLRGGMTIRGDFKDQIRRKLYESGRFTGWDLLLVRDGEDANQADLLVVLAEHWETPPLLAPLNRRQKALLRFAEWINDNALTESDLVLSLHPGGEHEFRHLEMAVGAAGLGLAAEMKNDHRFGFVSTGDGKTDVLVQAGTGSFHASSINELPGPRIFMHVTDTVEEDFSFDLPHPSLKTGSIALAAAITNRSTLGIDLRFDPASALRASLSHQNLSMHFENGEVTLGSFIRFEEATGRLVELFLPMDEEHAGSSVIRLKTEKGAVGRLRRETQDHGATLPKIHLENGASMLGAALGAIIQAVANDEEFLEETPTAMLKRLGTGFKGWTPLAEVLSQSFQSVDWGKAEDEDRMQIPLAPEDLALVQEGGTLALLLGLGLYEGLSGMLEPGSWPDRVLQETLYYLGGQRDTLNTTAGELLEDQSMGPLGSLLCSALLSQAQHGAQRSFVEKARRELTHEGFAKDWRLFFQGSAKDGHHPIGKLIDGLRGLEKDYFDSLLPDTPLRRVLTDLLTELQALEATATPESLAPVMRELWEELHPEMAQLIDAYLESLQPVVDTRAVAATVNSSVPVYRGSVPFMERTAHLLGIEQTARNGLEESINWILFGEEMRKRKLIPTPQFVENMAAKLADSLGTDGWKQISGMGMTREQYHEWIAQLLPGYQFMRKHLKDATIREQEVKAFYLGRPDLFGAVAIVPLQKLTVRVEGDAGIREAALQRLAETVKAAGSPEKMAKVFASEGQQMAESDNVHYSSYEAARPADDYSPALATAIAGVPDGKISAIIRETLRDTELLHLVLIAGERKVAEAQPFELVRDKARKYAIKEREARRLRAAAHIQYFKPPSSPGELARAEAAAKAAPSGRAMPGGRFIHSFKQRLADTAKKLQARPIADKDQPGIPSGHANDYEDVRSQAATGSVMARYTLGTYAERGIGTDPGMESAMGHYERAASEGSSRAMLRLAEIYRLGLGVARDPKKAKDWITQAEHAMRTPPQKARHR